MPTTEIKNTLYRLALPFFAPRLERNPSLIVSGDKIYSGKDYVRLLQRHHVMGTATLLKDSRHRVILLCSSRNPKHLVKEHSLFRVASITKMATSLAVMMSVEQQRLSLDQPVLDFFRPAPDVKSLQGVTLKHLLSHTSGLKDPVDLESALINEIPFPDIIQKAQQSDPGQVFNYSNLGFGLIGCVLESVYQKPISIILKHLIFQPLKMNATLDASELNRDEIVPITRVLTRRPGKDLYKTALGERPLIVPDPMRHYGHTAGAMYLDLPSLEKLIDCLMRDGKPLLKTNLGKEMIEKHAEYGKLSPTLSYGLGILRIHDNTLSESLILGHQGFAYGCADGAFWEQTSGRMVLFLNGGASEARIGRLGLCNYELLKWALRKEMPQWSR